MRTTILPNIINSVACRLAGAVANLARRTHRDQHGSISILTVFAALLLTMLIGMVMNVGRQLDGKLRMQNAADAAAYSGGVVLARGLNSLAFTNRLLYEVFAMTAFLREAHDRHSDPYVPDILAAWKDESSEFAKSSFPKFQTLGTAIPAKAAAEQELVTAFSNWAAALAGGTPADPNSGALPLMETILREHLITNYQLAVVQSIPGMAQRAAMTVADKNGQKNGEPDNARGPMSGVLWRVSTGQVVSGDMRDWLVVDPQSNPGAGSAAQSQRNQFAQNSLAGWNQQVLAFFDYGAMMCQFGHLWRGFTCGQLQKLLQEYPDTNLPFSLREELSPGATLESYESYMDEKFTFLAVVSWARVPEMLPGLYHSAGTSDSIAYAQVRVFLPTSRLVWQQHVPSPSSIPMGGVPEYNWPSDSASSPSGATTWVPGRQSGVITTGLDAAQDWTLFNQHWTCQLVPAVPAANMTRANGKAARVLEILSNSVPGIAGISPEDLQQISYH
jgi:hypothetical protein